MATVRFNVPDDVKAEFDRTFGDANKSAVIAALMKKAVNEHRLQIRREYLFDQLVNARLHRPSVTSQRIQAVRTRNRP